MEVRHVSALLFLIFLNFHVDPQGLASCMGGDDCVSVRELLHRE